MALFRKAAGVIALLAAAPLSADAPSPLVLQPATGWSVDYADERCSLMRTFGEGEQSIRLQVDSFGNPYRYRLLLVGKPLPHSAVRATGSIRYRLSPDSEPRQTATLEGRSNDLAAISFDSLFGPEFDWDSYTDATDAGRDSVRAQFLAGLGAYREKVDAITLYMRGDHMIELRLGRMTAPIAALETCIDDMYKSWGLDPAQTRALERPPVPISATVRNLQRRYPSDMILSGTNAYVPVRVMVDASGKPTGCAVQVQSVDAAFKEAVCAGMARGFEPALDSDGRPVAAMFQTAVLFLVNGA